MFFTINHLSKSFNNNVILDDISFEVNQGEVVAVIGSSGAGKSTLLRAINVLERPDNGQMAIDGFEVDFSKISKKEVLKLRQMTAMVFQQFNLFNQKTALDNIKEGLKIVKNLSDAAADKIARQQLQNVGLSSRAEYYPQHLSGGQQQRIGIARALAMEPKILLLDEPTSALDPELIGEVLRTIKDTAASGQTMILVSHEMNFVYEVADKVLFLEQGKIIESGTPQQLFDQPQSERTKQFIQGFSKR